MTWLTRTFFRWLPLAGAVTALCLLIYVVSQQVWRDAANDPQVQLARDAAVALESGHPIDSVVPHTAIELRRSSAPFLAVMNDAGSIVATSGELDGRPRAVPIGVLDHARQSGEERVSWQPERGVRIAAVVVRVQGAAPGFVLAGRSLGETEARVNQFQTLIGLGWALTMSGLLVLVAVSEYALSWRKMA